VESKIVDPSAVEIEAPTTQKQLTLYTCTPIWTAKERLVIIAKPTDPNSANLLENI
jgi:LPXTG-site transpeptidase (sortase) family protein